MPLASFPLLGGSTGLLLSLSPPTSSFLRNPKILLAESLVSGGYGTIQQPHLLF